MYPQQFYLQKGEGINIMVMHSPDEPKESTKELIIKSVMNTEIHCQIKGTGCILDLELMNSLPLNLNDPSLSVISFGRVKVGTVFTKEITIKNKTCMRVCYHWSVYTQRVTQKILLSEEITPYCIEPIQGCFEANGEINFTITFTPLLIESYSAYADLIVDNVPIEAIPKAPEALKTLLGSKVSGPTYSGSNTRYPSVPYLTFEMKGYGDSCEVIADPPIIRLPDNLLIFKQHSTTLTLRKNSKSHIKLKIFPIYKTSNTFNVQLDTFTFINGHYIGTLIEQIKTINITIRSSSIGRHNVTFIVEVENGNTLSFEVIANFIGPKVVIKENVIDFGLVRTYSQYQSQLTIQNISEVDAEVLIRTMDNIDTLFGEEKGKVKLLPEYKVLSPLESFTFSVYLLTEDCETLKDCLEVNIKYGRVEYIWVHAEVQRPYVFLNKTLIDLGTTYVDLKVNSELILINNGNLDTEFEVSLLNTLIVGIKRT